MWFVSCIVIAADEWHPRLTDYHSDLYCKITGGAAPTSWQVDNGDTNSLSFGFDLKGQAASDFTVAVADCQTHSDYTFNQSGDPSSGLTVTLTNSVNIVDTTYCLDVSLSIVGIGVVAKTTYSYQVESSATGVVTVVPSESVNSGDLQVATNNQGTGGANSDGNTLAGPAATDISISVFASGASAVPIQFGMDVTVQAVNSNTNFLIDISSVTGGGITYVSGASGTFVTTVDTEIISGGFPLSVFQAAAQGTSLVLTVGINWQDNTNNRRVLRALQDTTPNSGTATYQVQVELGGLEESGAAPIQYKIISITAVAGGAAALLW